MYDRKPDLTAAGPALVMVLCVLVGLTLGTYAQYVIAVATLSMLVGVALVVLVGLGRCITLASGSIMAIGAYSSTLAISALGLPYLLALLVALAAGAAGGYLIALPGARFRGHNLAMVTLVFQSVCIILIRQSTWLTGGAEGIHVPRPKVLGWSIASDTDFLILIGVVAGLMTLAVGILVRGPFGKNLQAAASNETAAEAFGISTRSYMTAAFLVSSVTIALAGALLAPRIRILDPDSFGVLASIFMLAYPIVGGMQSIWGGLIGGGALRILPEALRPVADYQDLFFAALVIVVIMFLPGGIVELLRRCGSVIGRAKPEYVRELAPSMTEATLPDAFDYPENTKPLLVVMSVDKHFEALHAVDSASLTVTMGGIHGLIGPNGAGKTSLFNVISGFFAADGGRVELAGISLLNLRARDRIRLGITRTFQNVAVFPQLSCLDNVVVGQGRNAVIHAMRTSFDHVVAGPYARAAQQGAYAALESVGLAHHARSPAAALSLGDQRRLEIARAVASDPRLILLDEPVSGLSEVETEELRKLLLRINSERNVAMLIVEHNIPFVARFCRTLSVMGAGKIVASGRPADVISLPAVRQLYFGEGTTA